MTPRRLVDWPRTEGLVELGDYAPTRVALVMDNPTRVKRCPDADPATFHSEACFGDHGDAKTVHDWLGPPLASAAQVPTAHGHDSAAVQGAGCQVVEGEDARRALQSAETKFPWTLWRSSGVVYRTRTRPMLPDELTCDALFEQ